MTALYGVLFALACCLLGYFSGCISNARIIAKAHGVDITAVGSHNPGGTNVWRTLGWKPGLLCMALDMLKGFLPTLLVLLLLFYVDGLKAALPAMHFQDHDHFNVYVCLTGFFAGIGHSFPVFEHFKGGKNVMVVTGFLLAVAPAYLLVCFAIFGLVLLTVRKVAVASLSAAASVILLGIIPVVLTGTHQTGFVYCGLYLGPEKYFLFDWISYLFILASAALVIVRHAPNIKKIRSHTDKKDF